MTIRAPIKVSCPGRIARIKSHPRITQNTPAIKYAYFLKFPVLVGPYARPTSIFKKYAYFIAGVFCVILGWLFIRAILPGQDTFIGALIVIALGIFFLFCGQRLIFKSLASAPANSDYRPVANVSSLSAPCGLAPPSARLGAAS